MANNSASENSRTKKFIINNRQILKQYAQKKQDSIGLGIVVVNILLLATAELDESNLSAEDLEKWQEASVHQPVSYIPDNNFWFKMINLKIKKKHKIDIQTQSSTEKTFVVFIKDAALENFSIYAIKNSKKAETLDR